LAILFDVAKERISGGKLNMNLNLSMPIEKFVQYLEPHTPDEIVSEENEFIKESKSFVFRKFYDEEGVYAIGEIRRKGKETMIRSAIVIRKDVIQAIGPGGFPSIMRNRTFFFHGVSRDKKTRRNCFSSRFVETVTNEIGDTLTLKILMDRGITKEDFLEELDARPPFKISLTGGDFLERLNALTPSKKSLTMKEIKKVKIIGGKIATKEVNYAIKDLLKSVDSECWEVARKFSRDCKYTVYLLSALEGERFMQLAQASPVTVKHMSASPIYDELIQDVRDGKKLLHIMGRMSLPYCMRKIPAKFVRSYERTYTIFNFCPQLFFSMMQFMPKNKNMQMSYIRTSHEFVQRLWFGCVRELLVLHGEEQQEAFDNCTEFQLGVKMHHWIMRNYEAMDQYEKSLNGFRRTRGHAGRIRENFQHIEDYFWGQFRYEHEAGRYRAVEQQAFGDHGFPFEGVQIGRGRNLRNIPCEFDVACEFDVDRFDNQVALHTIQDRVREWDDRRDAEYARRAGVTPRGKAEPKVFVFPDPWIESQTIEKRKTVWEFIPIANYEDLIEEGKKQRHCVACYASSIVQHRCYIYSLKKNGKRNTTIELQRREGMLEVVQARTACNGKPENSAFRIIDEWLEQNKNV
jgi:hypothetical protein